MAKQTPERLAELRAEARAKGYCVKCRKRPLHPGSKANCAECLEKSRAYRGKPNSGRERMQAGVPYKRNLPKEERFWAHVDKSAGANGCWPWKAAVRKDNGYGAFTDARRTQLAHRVAHELSIGPIGKGLQVDHICNNPRCVNPRHLRAVDGRTNNLAPHSSTLPGLNFRKSHCAKGHEFTPENTRITPRGIRICQTCKRASWKASYYKKRAVIPKVPKAYKTKIADAAVREILNSSESANVLAYRLGVSEGYIYQLRRRKWRKSVQP